MKHLFVLVSALSTICFFANKSAGIDVFVDCSGGIATVIPDIVYVDVGQTVTWRVDVLCENLFCLGPPTFFNIYVPAGPFGEEWRSEQFLISGEIPVTSPTVVNCASNLMYSVGFWDLIEPVCGAMAYIDSSGDDSDCDGISNEYDNCFDVANTDQADADGDCIGDACDTDPFVYDPAQPDTYPPLGNDIGDACDCEGDFDCDGDCDGTDAALFKSDFGRSGFNDPCENGNTCNGDFDCDNDCDGTDAALFKDDFGRSDFNNPCPVCVVGGWCSYEFPALIPKTGQTISYAEYDDGYFQSGVPWPNPRFTDNSDGTVTDNLTGLIWLEDANCFGMRTWNSALSDSNELASGSCGLTDGSSAGDWRLPNKNELASLVHNEYYRPALPNTAGTGQWSAGDPFTNVQSSDFWSSSTSAYNTDYAWGVYMHQGYVRHYHKTSSACLFYVWPVRGGQ